MAALGNSSSLLLRKQITTRMQTHQTIQRHFSSCMTSRDARVLFEYTSGRWVYNEQRRMRERVRAFDIIAFQRLAAVAASKSFDDVLSIRKLGEGASARAFIIDFRDGFKLVARIPYPVTQPAGLVVASEAATLSFLRSKSIPVPKVYGYSATTENPAGTEYIFMEFSPGKELSTVWHEMNEQDRHRFVRSLVDLEARLFELSLPASGSLYFRRDLPAALRKLAVSPDDNQRPESLYVGPSTSLDLWYGRRAGLDVDRGPFIDAEAVLNAGAKKEVKYLESCGRPLLPMDRMRRETFNLEKQLPSVHLDSLEKYSQIAKHLIPQGNPELLRPILRHPDLRSSNIFVSDIFEITSLIDWQNSTIQPLFLHSSIPGDLDNSRDPVSRSLDPPSLPLLTDDMEVGERSQELDVFARRQLHHLYMTETAKKNPLHFGALSHPFSFGRRKIFRLSSAPWEGDNIPLRSSLIFVKRNWQAISGKSDFACPINFTPGEEQECLRLDELEQEADEQLESSKAMLGLGPEGWVSNERYASVQAAIARIKALCLEEAESEVERRVIREHWVFDDMDEDEYL